ncbi:hypothetical protein EMCRGX_G022848 [Ephydatia muelleri]
MALFGAVGEYVEGEEDWSQYVERLGHFFGANAVTPGRPQWRTGPGTGTPRCYRICGDFRLTVNQALETERYPLPKIEDILASLAVVGDEPEIDEEIDQEARPPVIVQQAPDRRYPSRNRRQPERYQAGFS